MNEDRSEELAEASASEKLARLNALPEILGQLGETSAAASGHPDPRSVYMFYMKLNPGGELIVKHHWELDYPDSLTRAEARLFQAASGVGAPAQGYNFDNIIWQRPYYLTFVIDNPDWHFFWGSDGDDQPLRFLRYKGNSSTIHITERHSFSDATRVLGLGSGDAFRMINYHVNQNGIALPYGARDKYCFEIYLEAPFAIDGNPNTHIVLVVDPDGQNQGPRT